MIGIVINWGWLCLAEGSSLAAMPNALIDRVDARSNKLLSRVEALEGRLLWLTLTHHAELKVEAEEDELEEAVSISEIPPPITSNLHGVPFRLGSFCSLPSPPNLFSTPSSSHYAQGVKRFFRPK